VEGREGIEIEGGENKGHGGTCGGEVVVGGQKQYRCKKGRGGLTGEGGFERILGEDGMAENLFSGLSGGFQWVVVKSTRRRGEGSTAKQRGGKSNLEHWKNETKKKKQTEKLRRRSLEPQSRECPKKDQSTTNTESFPAN